MKYLYSGPPSGVTLVDGDTVQEIILCPGRDVDLPPEHAYTRTLLALAHLTPIPDSEIILRPRNPSGASQPKSAPADKADTTSKGD